MAASTRARQRLQAAMLAPRARCRRLAHGPFRQSTSMPTLPRSKQFGTIYSPGPASSMDDAPWDIQGHARTTPPPRQGSCCHANTRLSTQNTPATFGGTTTEHHPIPIKMRPPPTADAAARVPAPASGAQTITASGGTENTDGTSRRLAATLACGVADTHQRRCPPPQGSADQSTCQGDPS